MTAVQGAVPVLLANPSDVIRDARIAALEAQVLALTRLLDRISEAQRLLAQTLILASAQRKPSEALQ